MVLALTRRVVDAGLQNRGVMVLASCTVACADRGGGWKEDACRTLCTDTCLSVWVHQNQILLRVT